MNEQEIFKFFPETVFKYKLEDFKKWRREIMEDIYNDYINQNKDE